MATEEEIRADERARVVRRLQWRFRWALDHIERRAIEGDSWWESHRTSIQGAMDLVGWLAEEMDFDDKLLGESRRDLHDINTAPWETGPIVRNLFKATSTDS